MINISNTIYSRRKRFLPEYRKLFDALLQIPDEDEDVKKRVTDAVNGIMRCSQCKSKISTMDIATQTDDNANAELIHNNGFQSQVVVPDTAENQTKPETQERKRRKRKRNFPKAVNTAQHSNIIPVLKQEVLPVKQTSSDYTPQKIMRQDSDDLAVSHFIQNDFDIIKNFEAPAKNAKTVENIKQQMKEEWEKCQIVNAAGLLPIHEAIVQNEITKLKRQIYVWEFKKVDRMELLTDVGDNLVQLAIKEDCLKSIIDEVLKEATHLNNLDDDCNTIFHLAVSHLSCETVTQKRNVVQLFDSIAAKVELKNLLIQNNDGLTALHLAVKNNEYIKLEKILNIVDQKLNLKSVTPLDKPEADEAAFSQHYCKQCENFEEREEHDLKRQILSATDMKRGCTVLFFAMELGYDHIVYLLMAHMCNPTIKNLAGIDAKTYYADYGKNAIISGALERLTAYLQK